jgi:hypothetical protein
MLVNASSGTLGKKGDALAQSGVGIRGPLSGLIALDAIQDTSASLEL